ncbi:hypothetical protein QZH41_010494, partial [Actinostola sp. cb2023]
MRMTAVVVSNFGPGPITPEQAQELEKLKLIYAKLLKSQGDVIITHQNPATSHVQVAIATPPGILQQGVAPQQTISTVQRIVPAVTSNQVPTSSAPVTTTVTILPQGSTIPTKITVTSPTTLTTAQIQQIQAQALSQVRTAGQPQTVQIMTSALAVPGTAVPITQQQQIVQEQVKVAVPVAGQRIISGTPGGVTIATASTPVTGLKPPQGTVQTGIKLTTNSQAPSVSLQRQLAPNKIQGGITASQSTLAGSMQNIAPSSTASTVPKNLVSHTGVANRVETSSPQPQQVLTKRRIQELLHEIDPQEQMDDDVEDVRLFFEREMQRLLLQIADDFIESVVSASCQIAKHRKSNTLEVKDVQLHLERCWNMWIPGFGSDELRPYKKAATTEAHKQ